MNNLSSFKKINITELDNLEDKFEESLHIFWENDTIYHVDAWARLIKDSEYLICAMPSAQASNLDVKNPIFHRWSWYKNFPNVSYIVLSDPALYGASLHGTWFLSEGNVDIIELLSNFINKLCNILNISTTKVIFYGSSMGGFGSLMLASSVKGSMAIAEVPQLDLSIYPFKSALNDIEKHILKNKSFTDFSTKESYKTNVIARFIKEENIPCFRIITNKKDSAFVEHLDFISSLKKIYGNSKTVGDVQLSIVSNDIGHAPLPAEFGIKYINTAIAEGWSYKEKDKNNESKRLQADSLSELDYKELIDKAVNLVNSLKFIRTNEELAVYQQAKNLLYRAGDINPTADWPYLKICQIVKLWTNSFNKEIFECACKAFSRKQTLEAFIYSCRGYLYNFDSETASKGIDLLIENTRDQQTANVGNIFQAILSYDKGDFKSYKKYIKEFKYNKAPNFNPYIAIPVSTVFIEDYNFTEEHSLQLMNTTIVREELDINENIKYIVSVSCDLTYFLKYGKFFIKSFQISCAKESILHISVLNGDSKIINNYLEEWGNNNIIISIQNLNTEENIGPIASLLRFMHIESFLKDYQLPVVVLDFDTVIKKSLLPLIEVNSNVDISSRVLEASGVAPWEKYTGGFSIFNSTLNSLYVARAIAYVGSMLCKGDRKQWWIDQNCFEAGIRKALEEKKSLVIQNVFNVRNEYCVMPVGSDDSKLYNLEKALDELQSKIGN